METTPHKRKNKDCLRTVWEAAFLYPWSTAAQLVKLTGFPSGTVKARLSELEELNMATSVLRPGEAVSGRTGNVRHYQVVGTEYVHPSSELRYATRKAKQAKVPPQAVELPPIVVKPRGHETAQPIDVHVYRKTGEGLKRVELPPSMLKAQELNTALATPRAISVVHTEDLPLDIENLPLRQARALYRELHKTFGHAALAA